MAKILQRLVCCPNGIAELKITVPTAQIFYWEHPPSGQSGSFDTSQVEANRHPVSALVRRENPERIAYAGRTKLTFGDRPPEYHINSGTTCLHTKVIMNYYSEWYGEFYGESMFFERPSNLQRTINGGFFIYFYTINEEGESRLVQSWGVSGEPFRWLDKVEVVDLFYQDHFTPWVICSDDSCLLQLQDRTGYPVYQKRFTNLESSSDIRGLCPKVLSKQCFYAAENEEVKKYFLEYSDTLEGDILGEVVRTIKQECLAVYTVEENKRYGLEIAKITKTTTITYSPQGGGQMPTEFTEESTEETTIKVVWSPNGCDYPNFSLLCQDTEKCPPNTAYSCKREDGKTCCYDCDGNIISVIE